MDETLSNWPNQAVPESTARMWLALWKEMVEEYGTDNFEKALWTLCKTAKFCPVPGEIKSALEEMKPKELPRYYLPPAPMEMTEKPMTKEDFKKWKAKLPEETRKLFENVVEMKKMPGKSPKSSSSAKAVSPQPEPTQES